MGVLRKVQTNMTSGVLDDSMKGRIDLQVYQNGVAVAKNVRLRPQGGATRRAGTVAVIKHNYDCQVEPFVFSETESYVCFFRNGNVDIFDRVTRTLVSTLAGPWTTTHVQNEALGILQQYDKMFVSHVDFQTRVITRTGLSTFSIGTMNYQLNSAGTISYQPYHKYAADAVTLTPSAASGAITMTSSAAFFTVSMVGYQFLFGTIPFNITGYTSPTQVSAAVIGTFPSTTASIDWQEPAFSPWRGWIRSLGLHEQRLWIGGGRDCPNVLWGSVAGVPLNFDLGTAADDDAIKYAISQREVIDIKAIESFTHMQIFTSSGEFYVPQPQTGGLKPTNMAVKKTSGYGCSNITPKVFDQSTIFVTKKSKALREFTYDDVRVSYAADSLSLLAKKLSPSPVDLQVQIEGNDDEQEARAYLPDADGTIAVLSKVKKENVAAWSQWTTQGSFKKACVSASELWLHVERTINGVTSKYIEVSDVDALLDFQASATGAASKTWGPFNLHKGQTVHVLSDLLYFGEMTVDATTGMIELPVEVTEVQIGLAFTPEIVPLVQEVVMPNGTTMGEFKRVVSVTAMLEDTMSCKIKNRSLPSGLPIDDPSTPAEATTGPFQAWNLGWSKTEMPTISAPEPLPFTLSAIVYEVEV